MTVQYQVHCPLCRQDFISTDQQGGGCSHRSKSRTSARMSKDGRQMRLSQYDAALEAEAALHPDRAEEIAAERERIAPELALEIAGEPLDAELGDIDALVEAALADEVSS